MDSKKTYKTIKSLEFQLMIYPNSRQQILDNAGKDFKIDGEKHWFVVAENGGCALFDKDCKIDDLSKVKTIAEDMVRKDIKSINIPDSVESIGEWAFNNCIFLTSINIPDSVKSIGKDAFYICKSLESIIIPNSVESIGDYAFFWCKSLESIIIPDSVESIGEWAFSGCLFLISINIPDSVESIGKQIFFGCESLENVVFKGKTLDEVKAMKNYPWDADPNILKAQS